MARAWVIASSRVTPPSRRPKTAAEAALEVAKASKPTPARTRAEPMSQGFGIKKAPALWCSSWNRDALSDCVAVIDRLIDGPNVCKFNDSLMKAGKVLA